MFVAFMCLIGEFAIPKICNHSEWVVLGEAWFERGLLLYCLLFRFDFCKDCLGLFCCGV